MVHKVLASAVANARNNEQLDPDELYVSACYADEGTTLKRWRPRARGRATRIRKRTCHITVIVSRLPEDRLERRRARQNALTTGLRSRRVAASRRGEEGRGGERERVGTDTLGPDTLGPDTEGDELETTSADVLADDGDEADGESTEVDAEGVVIDDDEGGGEEPVSNEADAEAGAEAEEEPEVEVEVEVEAEKPPAPKPRHARSPRKSTTKAAKDAAEGEAGGAGEEEKG